MAELVVALDVADLDGAMRLGRSLAGRAPWVKVGLELYTACGPEVVSSLKSMGFKVFCDLKFHDIPNTVAGAVASAGRAGADMVNIHLTGGDLMIEAARTARDETAPDMLLFGVTVLTSLSSSQTEALYGRPAGTLVLDLAKKAYHNGLDGIVCSAHEAAAVKKATSQGLKCLTPGIRLRHTSDDQQRVADPAFAVGAGADYLVVGRPITRDASPAEAAGAFLAEIKRAQGDP